MTNKPELCRLQPCGCVVCFCEHETRCMGCGAKHCGTHPVGQFPAPAYQQAEYGGLQAECEKLREFVEHAKTLLEDPIAVFVNMKAGVIAKPSLRDLIDLHGDVPNGEDVQLLEIARLRSECEKLRDLLRHAQPIIKAHAEASHMLEGFRPRRNGWDELVEAIDAAMQEVKP